MRFSMNSKKWASGLLAASLALPLVGCSPEASTSGTKPSLKADGSVGSVAGKAPKEQAGSTMSGSSAEKGREAPEPNPAETKADEKPADEKPKEE